MLDAMAERYGCLPSEILRRGDTFDLMTFDVAVTYREMQHAKNNQQTSTHMYDNKELENIFENVRNR